ncbi:MAG TPA: protein-(glutamine-N5) methyltransferase, release factor-specific, partial [Candidatus Binatia bacterium]|nr:protein-(glutamine-N5) methyltransferase, release factor-specific [Candidatus Binatia bacterium]
ALSAGPDPLAVHRRLARECVEFLKPVGHLIAEMGLGQENALRALYGGQSGLEVAVVNRDLAGIPRVLVVRARP